MTQVDGADLHVVVVEYRTRIIQLIASLATVNIYIFLLFIDHIVVVNVHVVKCAHRSEEIRLGVLRLRRAKLLADGKDVIRTVNIMLKHVFILFFFCRLVYA